jgi:hypothetical protein
MNIGDWVAREKRGKAHLVESIVSGDVVTRCGRRLTDEPTVTGGALVAYAMRSTCLLCRGTLT